MSREKTDDEYRKEFKQLHEKFVKGEGNFIGDDLAPINRKKKSCKSKNRKK
jgi:hypothetical protein